MNLAYINGEYLPLEEARISPLDRGFLFGDGIYEVVPTYGGRFVGWDGHVKRMRAGLNSLEIEMPVPEEQLRNIAERLVSEQDTSVALYMQITRGPAPVRKFYFPEQVTPTLFMACFPIPDFPQDIDADLVGISVHTEQDTRWQHRHIKSVALLGAVLHQQSAVANGLQETLLYGEDGNVNEASSSNVFLVKDGIIKTPPLSNRLLAGVTRGILIDIIRSHSTFDLIEEDISKEELATADEIWLSSASRGVAPIVNCDGASVSNGEVGPIAKQVAKLYLQHMFDY